ncbi:gamma-glutamylcyclotransferase [bacterium]|nr:gamma-glutamylcyclotransferase [bacterium]
MPTVLFVYGTLKRGEPAHRLIADQTFLGPAVTAPRYRLADLGPFPGLVRDDTAGLAVSGELWEVSDCCRDELDDFEGCPALYTRERIDVAEVDAPVEAYFYVRPVPRRARTGPAWPFPSTREGGG